MLIPVVAHKTQGSGDLWTTRSQVGNYGAAKPTALSIPDCRDFSAACTSRLALSLATCDWRLVIRIVQHVVWTSISFHHCLPTHHTITTLDTRALFGHPASSFVHVVHHHATQSAARRQVLCFSSKPGLLLTQPSIPFTSRRLPLLLGYVLRDCPQHGQYSFFLLQRFVAAIKKLVPCLTCRRTPKGWPLRAGSRRKRA